MYHAMLPKIHTFIYKEKQITDILTTCGNRGIVGRIFMKIFTRKNMDARSRGRRRIRRNGPVYIRRGLLWTFGPCGLTRLCPAAAADETKLAFHWTPNKRANHVWVSENAKRAEQHRIGFKSPDEHLPHLLIYTGQPSHRRHSAGGPYAY